MLATGSKDNTIRLWNLNTGENVAVLTGHQDNITVLHITSDGETLISGSGDGTLKIWRWDLSRLCNITISMINKEDQEWIKNALNSENISIEERNWLMLLEKVILMKNEDIKANFS